MLFVKIPIQLFPHYILIFLAQLSHIWLSEVWSKLLFTCWLYALNFNFLSFYWFILWCFYIGVRNTQVLNWSFTKSPGMHVRWISNHFVSSFTVFISFFFILRFGFNSEKHSSKYLTLRMCLNSALFFNFFFFKWKRRLTLSALQSKKCCHFPTGWPPYFSHMLSTYFKLRFLYFYMEYRK